MDEEKLRTILSEHFKRVEDAYQKWTDRIATTMGQLREGMQVLAEATRDSAKIADEGPRERWRQNLAASMQLTLLKEHYRACVEHDKEIHTMAPSVRQLFAEEAVKHADALLAAIEKKP